MKILFFGNTNNQFTELILYLAKNGHIVHHVLTQRGDLHDPIKKHRSYKSNNNIKLIDFRYMDEEELILHPYNLKQELNKDFDLAFLDEMGPSFVRELDCPVVSIVIGYNLTTYASREFASNRSMSWDSDFRKSNFGQQRLKLYEGFSELQRYGFKESDRIVGGPFGIVPSEDLIFAQLEIDSTKFISSYIPKLGKKFRYQLYKRQFVNKKEYKVIFPARLDKFLNHVGLSERNDKGFEKMLDVINYFSSNPAIKFIFFNKGFEAAEFFNELEELGLMDNVEILEPLPYSKFIKVLATADVVVDSIGASPPGRISSDAIQLGIPVICNFNKSFLDNLISDKSPSRNYVYSSSNAESVIQSLSNILKSYQNKDFDLMMMQNHSLEMTDIQNQYLNIIKSLNL